MGSSETEASVEARGKANEAYEKYKTDYDANRSQYEGYRQQADKALASDFGQSGADFTNKANRAGMQTANAQLAQGAKGNVAASQLAARSAGMSKGQAAMMSAGNAGQYYNQNYLPAAQMGAQQYQQNALNYQGQMSGRQALSQQGMLGSAANMNAATGTVAQTAQNQKSEWDKNFGVLAGAGGAVSGIGGLIGSDRRLKTVDQVTDYAPYFDRIKKIMGEINGGK